MMTNVHLAHGAIELVSQTKPITTDICYNFHSCRQRVIENNFYIRTIYEKALIEDKLLNVY